MTNKQQDSLGDWLGTLVFFGIIGLVAYGSLKNEIDAQLSAFLMPFAAIRQLSPVGIAALVMTIVVIVVAGALLTEQLRGPGMRTVDQGTPAIVAKGVGKHHGKLLRAVATFKKKRDAR